jgi:hypothetical protein
MEKNDSDKLLMLVYVFAFVCRELFGMKNLEKVVAAA